MGLDLVKVPQVLGGAGLVNRRRWWGSAVLWLGDRRLGGGGRRGWRAGRGKV